MEKLTKESGTRIFAGVMVFLIVGSFVALVIAHIFALAHGNYSEAAASQETIFIALLTLALAIVLILPHTITKEQMRQSVGEKIEQEIKEKVERRIENYWENFYQNKINQFISKSTRDYAHTSRMIAYLLKQKKHYYWAMTWASDSVVAYIKRFKVCPTDFELNKEYFEFSLNIMKISFNEREKGEFLEDNMDLEGGLNLDGNSKKSFFSRRANLKVDEALMNGIRGRIYEGKKITQNEKKIIAVEELKLVILRYIKWQCLIYIEKQEHEKLSYDVTDLIEKYLGSTFKQNFKVMVNNILKSFYNDDEKNADNVDKEQFINNVVKKVEFEEQEKVRKYLEEMLKG